MVTSESLYAMSRYAPSRMSYPTVSQVAVTSLGVVTDTEYLTLEPSVTALAMEIIGVLVHEDPIAGQYANVWITLKANAASPFLGVFCRILDDDTGEVVGYKKNWYAVATGDEWVAKYNAFDDWSKRMPDRVWNLRVEVGTN